MRLTIDWDKLCGVKKNQETFRNEVCWFLIYHFILGILTDEPQRYKLMSEYCRKNSIHFLFTGHNKNDQVKYIFIGKKNPNSFQKYLFFLG